MNFNAQQRESESKGNLFVKLGDGESIKGVLRGDLWDFHSHWVGNKSELCPGQSNCQHCADDIKARFRFRVNLVVNENGAFTAKLFEGGWTIYKALELLQETGYDLETTTVQISRKGEKLETEWTVMPVPNGVLAGEVLSAVSAVKLLDLDWKKDKPSL